MAKIMLRDKRNSLRQMLDALNDAGISIKEFYEDDKDRKTTLFEAVRGLFDDKFADEIMIEDLEAQSEMDLKDEEFEMKNRGTSNEL